MTLDSSLIQYVIIRILIPQIKQNCVKVIIRMFTREINSNKADVFPKDVLKLFGMRCPRLKAAATDSGGAKDRLLTRVFAQQLRISTTIKLLMGLSQRR